MEVAAGWSDASAGTARGLFRPKGRRRYAGTALCLFQHAGLFQLWDPRFYLSDLSFSFGGLRSLSRPSAR